MKDTDSQNIAAFFARAASGDVSAFTYVIERYQSLVCAISYSILRDRALSEDISQQVFLTLWRCSQELEKAESLPGWLRTTTKNACYEWLRKNREVPAPLAIESAQATPDDTPFENLAAKERAVLVGDALGKLKDEYREPLVLFYRESESVEAVAHGLGISIDAVKKRLSRGRQFLAESLLPAFVQEIRQTSPSKSFTVAVVAAISAMAMGSATAAVGTNSVRAQDPDVSALVSRPTAWGRPLAAALATSVLLLLGLTLWPHLRARDDSATTRPLAQAKMADQAVGAFAEQEVDPEARAEAPNETSVGPFWVDGYVFDEEHSPIANAAISLASSADTEPQIMQSDATGYFSFGEVRAGQYIIHAETSERRVTQALSLLRQRSPLMLTLERRTRVKVTVLDARTAKPIADANVIPGQYGADRPAERPKPVGTDSAGQATVDVQDPATFTVEKEGYAIFRYTGFLPQGGLEHTVVVLTPGCRVTGQLIKPSSRVSMTLKNDDDGFSARSTEDGAFAFTGIPAGEYELEATSWTFSTPPPLVTCHPPQSVELPPLTLAPARAITGVVVDEAGHPLENVDVSIRNMSQPVLTNDEGQFAISGPPGPVTLIAERFPLRSLPAEVPGEPYASQVRLVLTAGVIHGQVVATDGSPQEGVVVSALADEVEIDHASDITDEDGRFTLVGLSNQRYRLAAGGTAFTNMLGSFLGGAQPAAKPGDKNVKIVLPATTSARAKVVDDRGAMVPSCKVTATRVNPFGFPKTIRLETATMNWNHLEAAEMQFRFECPGFVEATASATLAATAPTDLGTIQVSRGATITGRVVTSQGVAVPAAAVFTASDQGLSFSFSAGSSRRKKVWHNQLAITDADGRFTVSGLSPNVSLSAEHAIYGSSATGGLGKTNEVILVMETEIVVTGRVMASNKPAAYTELNFACNDIKRDTRTDADGAYSISLPRGHCHVFTGQQAGAQAKKLGEFDPETDVPHNFDLGVMSSLTIEASASWKDAALVLLPGHTEFRSLAESGGESSFAFVVDTESSRMLQMLLPGFAPKTSTSARYAAFFTQVSPGQYTLCGVRGGLGSLLPDAKRLEPPTCKWVEVSDQPAILAF